MRIDAKKLRDLREHYVNIAIITIRTFDPELVRKRQTILAESLEDKIIGLYGLGLSYRDISKRMKCIILKYPIRS